jgi:hypothetical protein
MQRLAFYSWAIPAVGLALVIAWSVTFLVPIGTVLVYLVIADRATLVGALSALTATICCMVANDKLLVVPIARRWVLPLD